GQSPSTAAANRLLRSRTATALRSPRSSPGEKFPDPPLREGGQILGIPRLLHRPYQSAADHDAVGKRGGLLHLGPPGDPESHRHPFAGDPANLFHLLPSLRRQRLPLAGDPGAGYVVNELSRRLPDRREAGSAGSRRRQEDRLDPM